MYVHGTISTQPALKLEKWWGKLSDRSRLFVRCAVHIQHYLPAHCTSRLGQAITNHPLKPHTFLSPPPPCPSPPLSLPLLFAHPFSAPGVSLISQHEDQKTRSPFAMVELRKRKAPAPPPVVEKKSKPAPKPKAPKETEETETPKETPKSTVPDVGDTIDLDTFGGEIETNDGTKTTLKKLVEESKSGVVLFTYPKASTPGCTFMSFAKTFRALFYLPMLRNLCAPSHHSVI